MGKEIERKFLVRRDLWYAFRKPVGINIVQAYIVNEAGKVIRIRVAGESGFITIKGPVKEFTREEFEYPLPLPDAMKLMELFTVKRIEKTRYRIHFQNHLWEVDEFYGENDGLIIAEIELKSQEEAFETPSWLGEEVTFDHRYFNSYFSDHPFNSW